MPVPVNLPDGYRSTTGRDAWGFASDGAAEWLAELLASGRTLHAWAGAHPQRRPLAGRGRIWAVPAPAPGPTGTGGWVVRHYHRGGVMARFLHDRYARAGGSRPLAELRASLETSRRRIATPAVVAGAVYPAGAFYRADLVTEEIPGGVDLAGVLFGGRGAALPPPDALAAAGTLVRSLAEAGVRHRDLNAGNIVLQAGAAGLRAWVVDLDGCVVGRASTAAAGAMRRRLERSLRKLGARTGRPLETDAWDALRAGTLRPERAP